MTKETGKMTATKRDWQRASRRDFKKTHGYSDAAHYGAGKLRAAVLERDGHKCVKCGMTDIEHKAKWGRPITIDHKDKNRKNNTMDNLQTLCLSCHGRKDITRSLIERKVEKFKKEILKRRGSGESYQSIADDLGFSTASIWKWYKRWTTI